VRAYCSGINLCRAGPISGNGGREILLFSVLALIQLAATGSRISAAAPATMIPLVSIVPLMTAVV
jgi:hypothetical protein